MQITEAEARRARIVAILRAHGERAVSTLAEELGVSAQTLRADLRALDDARIVRRRHGVATLNLASENLGYGLRQDVAVEEKARIAAAVAARIPGGATVALGAGTTVEAVARALAGHRGLTVATNNLHVALAFRESDDVTVLMAGGELRLRDLDVIGPDSIGFFDGLNFDVAVFSVGGMTAQGALQDFSPAELQVRRALTACARERILALDSGKPGRAAPFAWGAAAELERVVCSAPLPEPAAAAIRRAGGEIALA